MLDTHPDCLAMAESVIRAVRGGDSAQTRHAIGLTMHPTTAHATMRAAPACREHGDRDRCPDGRDWRVCVALAARS